MNVAIDASRVTDELETLAGFSASSAPSVTRIVFSEQDLKARQYVKTCCLQAGLLLREDAVGNTFARWPGSDQNAAPVATGSHIDAIPNAGRFDGTVGVLGGLEAIRALQRANFKPCRPIELILFTSEEPTRFGIGCLGSRLLSGSLSADAASELRDGSGKTLDEIRTATGFHGSLPELRLAPHTYSAFVELHIEQGPLLERAGIHIGIVTGIAAPASLCLVMTGDGGHAGAVLMPDRHDALLGAAEIVLAVDSIARATGSPDSVATTGVLQVHPGAVNSIPSSVKLEIDIRDIDLARRDGMVQAIQQASHTIAGRRELQLQARLVNADAPTHCSPHIVDTIAQACTAIHATSLMMVSRAYHDSLFMSRIAPVSMIFIPCRNGYSHRPDEFASQEDIARGAAVLAHTLALLATS